MDLSEIIELDSNYLNDEVKEEIFSALIGIQNVDDVPRKNLRKILAVCLVIMRHKGEQVDTLHEQMERKTPPDSGEDSHSDRLQEENEKLKRMVTKLEEEKLIHKRKVKEMDEEIAHLQKRLSETMQSVESDKESSDPLSELDRQEELLKNINCKNKHIKRLLREIEALQVSNIEQSKTIIDLEKRHQQAKIQLQDLSSRVVLLDGENKALKESVNELNAELTRLEGNITYLEDEREKSEADLKQMIEKLESKAKLWRLKIDDKDKEIKKLKSKLESFCEVSIQEDEASEQPSEENEKQRITEESTRMMHAIEVRDKVIEKMESKIKTMAEEMMSSTRLMNKISSEREDERSMNPKISRSCCKIIEESLNASNDRCQELSELLEKSEEDNILKSKQAAQAIAALDAYQRGDDGLSKALKKINTLEQKLNSREKKIRELVIELNAMHEISNENALLRKKFDIPDDVVIMVKNRAAKERSKDKQIERLVLKLRSSEEMRLQLKLEKSDLRRQLIEFQRANVENTPQRSIEGTPLKSRTEMYCDNCLKNIQVLPNNDTIMQGLIKDWENKYTDVVEENESLRTGMHEILEKIREYDDTSDHITIDCEILERLLNALDARNWYHPAIKIQNELTSLKERELALRNKIDAIARADEVPSSNGSVDEVREVGEITDSPAASIRIDPLQPSTRPTSPNKNLDPSLYPVIIEADIEHESVKKEFLKTLEKNRSLQQEIQRLQVFQVQFEDLTTQMSASESDVTQYCSVLVEKLSALEIQFNTKNKTYEFLKDDFERTLSEFKASEMRNMALIADLKKQVNDGKFDLNRSRAENEGLITQMSTCNSEEYEDMQKTLFSLQSQVAALIDEVFSGKVPEIKVEAICTDYGVIQENMELEYMTVEEYEDIQTKEKELERQKNELQTKCNHLESLLAVSKEQVSSQQKLLTEITDNHINLRHLVADLQSSGEEKFLIAKIQRELDSAKKEISFLKCENEKYKKEEELLNGEIKDKEEKNNELTQNFHNQIRNLEIKSKFLQKALKNLRQKYFKFTPLIFLSNFVYAYSKFAKRSKDEEHKIQESISTKIDDIMSSKIQESLNGDTVSQDMIKFVKTETKAKYLEEQVQTLNQKNTTLQVEIDDLRLAIAKENEHWKTIEALFGEDHPKEVVEQEVQTEVVELIDSNTNTEKDDEKEENIATVSKADKNMSPIASPSKANLEKNMINSETQTNSIAMSSKQTSPIKTPSKQLESVEKPTQESHSVQTSPLKQLTHKVESESQGIQTSPKSSPKHQQPVKVDTKFQELESQLSASIALAENRKELLEKAEISLRESQNSIEELEKKLLDRQENKNQTDSEEKANSQIGIIEKTILSFHTLLSEKDKAIQKYQELVTSERNENDEACVKYEKKIESLQQTINDLSANVKAKDEEILELKTKIEAVRGIGKEKLEITSGVDENGDNSLQEISDEKIEEMFNDDGVSETSEKKLLANNKNNAREMKIKEKHWENTLKVKEEEITLLKEKINLYQEREKSDSGMNPEIDQLRILLEEKDKHINDLMDTLSNFHDDQQRFINDSSSYSADQISQLAATLTRSDATNKIYQAQLEALRRQLANINQREKQARELNNSLRNQLIKRPVVSIKTELNARLKTENLQKKVCQLETELEDAQLQIKRQQVVIDAKRAKTNNEVGLWEKQKRWQQSAEKFKAKFEETETALEKHKALLHSARTTISRLEKDKQILESRVGKVSNSLKCCRTPSCPNLQGTKYTPSETPETYTGGSECSSPARGMHFLGNNHNELIEALKARIEMQQRKIIAMEMEGKGSNALTTELEKLQEKYSAVEAQNIRLEAKNLQLQLDNDLLRQGDSGERMQKRVKHLEDYIIALKEELAQAEARRDLNFEHKPDKKYPPGQAEQTILSLRSIIEKLRAENRYLKDGTRQFDPRGKEAPNELTRLQHMYTESLDKISSLQIELQLKATCQRCGRKSHLEATTNDEVLLIRDQLLKKTQLLEKAKILLTRAAAKEKVLKEQLSLWKRKCSELQNVPVIDEISE